MTTVHHRYATVNGRRVFYREAGPAGAPTVVLLHGFPASSFMFRHLIPRGALAFAQTRPAPRYACWTGATSCWKATWTLPRATSAAS